MAGSDSAAVARMKRTYGAARDYVFGRNALIGTAALMLLALSGYATWHGMADFIIGAQLGDGAGSGREFLGATLKNEYLVIVIVVALTFLMWLMLRETFAGYRRFVDRILTFLLYAFLALWSVGFGYGFWWSLIAGGEATRAGLSGQAEDVRDAALRVSARLEAVSASLAGVSTFSNAQMSQEETGGGSCGVASAPGRGPLWNARNNVRLAVDNLRESIEANWLSAVRSDLEKLNTRVNAPDAALSGGTVAEREAQFRRATAEIRGQATAIAARSDSLGQSYASQMKALADQLSVRPGAPGFSCYDPRLASLLREASTQAGQPAAVTFRDAAFSEGPAGVANAVKGLWEKIGAGASGLTTWVMNGFQSTGEDAAAAADAGEPITGRDLIALLATLGVDIGLFVLTVLNPPGAADVRDDSLEDTLRRVYEPSPLVIRELSNAIRTALAIAPDASLSWVRRHFFTHLGYSFFTIPHLRDAPDGDEGARALAINQLAGVFAKMKLIEPVDRPRRGVERRTSRTITFRNNETRFAEAVDVASFKVETMGRQAAADKTRDAANLFVIQGFWQQLFGRAEVRQFRPDFFEKATRTLELAGWTGKAAEEPEIYFVYHKEGLEPLLTVLEQGEISDNDPAAKAAGRAATPARRSDADTA